MNRYLLVTAVVVVAGVALGVASCGNNGTTDGGVDANDGDGGGVDACASWNGCNPNAACTSLGKACQQSGDCCSQNCVSGSCQVPSCTADNAPCTTSGQCCSQTCGSSGTCTPLPTNCKTLGNPCTTGSECCSQFCLNNFCAQPSYCGQTGDICAQNSDCCSGTCTKTGSNAFGTCTMPSSGGCDIDGIVCGAVDGGTLAEGGLPTCGGSCCSRACAPWGPTKVLVCQPASGCKPVGDICATDSDCCGGSGTNPTQTCLKKNSTDPVGVCSNPSGCKPNGDICRLQTNQCNATDNCCSGNVQQFDTCHQDNLGVPRCSYAGDAGCIPPGADAGCSTSADCCNLNPCVNGKCGGGCVQCGGACSTSADCCPGGQCNIQSGQVVGTCDCSDAGTCALYGQSCDPDGGVICCNSIPCNAGRCVVPVN